AATVEQAIPVVDATNEICVWSVSANAAVTVRVVGGSTVQVADVPAQSPPQPVNAEPWRGWASMSSGTAASSEQSDVHWMAPSFARTAPKLRPSTWIVHASAASTNVTTTVWTLVTFTTHVVPLVLSQPDQPPNAEIASGTAVKVTLVPASKGAVQVAPQSMPAGTLVTVPPPEPASTTLRLVPPPQAERTMSAPVISPARNQERRREIACRGGWRNRIVLTIGARV